MKLEKKDYAFGSAFILIIVLLIVINSSPKERSEQELNQEPELTASTTPNPSPTPAIKAINSSPKPGLIVTQESDYEYWFNQMDKENRVFGIYGECTSIVPSNLTHKNNVTVMLDNTRSEKDHVLKIGPKEYPLKAGEWIITTLSATQLPARLTTFCEGIELGQIDLE